MSKLNILHSYPDLKIGGACKMMIKMANIMIEENHNVYIISSAGELKPTIHNDVNQLYLNLKQR